MHIYKPAEYLDMKNMHMYFAIVVALIISVSDALVIEEQFCGAGATALSCPIEDYDFFTQQLIALAASPGAQVNGIYNTVAGVDNIAKNNFIFFSSTNAVLDCTTSRALLFEVDGNDLPLANVPLSQFGTTSCLANFSMAISTTDLQKDLHFVLAVHDNIATATSSLGVQISTAIVPGTRPIHVWVSNPDANSATGIQISLNIKINAFPMIAAGCLETPTGLNLQLMKANDVVDSACAFIPETVVINAGDGTVFLEKTLTQTQYWACANSVTFQNSILTFLQKVVPSFDGCDYYEHHSYNPYLFNVFIEYILSQGQFGMVLTQSTTTADI